MRIRKLLTGLMLSLGIVTTFSLLNVNAESDGIIDIGAGKECLYGEFNTVSSATSYDAYVKNSTDSESEYTKLNSELVRVSNSLVRIDAVGLSEGSYNLKFVPKNGDAEIANKVIEVSDISVEADDRSGYAHFNYTDGVGAYNDDGTLKTGATVYYVSESNKNDLKDYITNTNGPTVIRIIGTIGAPSWNKIEYKDDAADAGTSYTVGNTTVTKNGSKDYSIVIKNSNGDELKASETTQETLIANGYNTLDGSYAEFDEGILTSKITCKSGEYDSYFNMMDIKNKSNITIEGIGNDANIDQWGFTWKSCTSIEIKNISFTNYPEDACSFEGAGKDYELRNVNSFTSTRYWIHNCTFNRGRNVWDVSKEQDKHEGDGATDFKRTAYVTLSYNKYVNTHKTGLIGGSDNQMTAAITFHHNWYNNCESRMPFARQANMHMYNNYYETSTGSTMQIYAGAYAFIENCYFKSDNKRFTLGNEYFKVPSEGTVLDGVTYFRKTGSGYVIEALTVGAQFDSKSKLNGVEYYEHRVPAIKSVGNYFDGGNTGATISNVDRYATVENNCIFGDDFDTNSSIFYTNYILDTNVEDLDDKIPTVAGVGKMSTTSYTVVGGNTDDEDPTVSYNNKSTARVLDDDFSVEKNIEDTTSLPTNPGIYKRIVTGKESGSGDISLTYSNSSLYLSDNHTKDTLNAYYIFGDINKYNSGIVNYAISVTIPQSGNWKFINYIVGNKEYSVGSVTIDNKKYLGWYDGSNWQQIQTTEFAANSKHLFTLKVNYDDSNVILDIDGDYSEVAFDITSAIDGIRFVTASGERSFYVNSISIEKEVNTTKLGYQLGKYTSGQTEYKALRIVGKFEYEDLLDSIDDIDTIQVDISLVNTNSEKYKTANQKVNDIYKSLKLSNGTIIAPEVDYTRYYYVVVKGITSSHNGYKINATTTITLKNGTVINCSGFSYTINI